MVEAAQQWWWTEAIVEYHRIVSYSVFVSQVDILCSFLRRSHTDRFPDDVPKKLTRNRNRDSGEKSATGAEKTGIRRIPAGIGNLAAKCTIPKCPDQVFLRYRLVGKIPGKYRPIANRNTESGYNSTKFFSFGEWAYDPFLYLTSRYEFVPWGG